MRTYPFAVISPRLGTRSETFIYRHMTELLPGRTAVVSRIKEPQSSDFNIRFPYLILGQRKLNWHWLYWGGLHFLRLNNLTPIQVRVKQYLSQHRVEVIMSEFLNASLKWLDVAKKLGVRFFAHAHGHDISAVLRDSSMQRRYLHLETADGIITVSRYSRDKLVAIGLSGKNIHVIPCGTDVPEAPRYRSNNKIIRCLAVGRMVSKKAPILALEAFLRASRSNPDLRLDFVGNGELFDEAKHFVHINGMNDKVTLHGGQPNRVVQALMKKADIFLQHSRTDPITGDEEGLPVAILEAMANSLPVVSTRHTGIPEAVLEDSTGYLVDEGDVDGMASQIIRLANNYEMRTVFGRSGWQRAKRYFSWEYEKAKLFELLGLEKFTSPRNRSDD